MNWIYLHDGLYESRSLGIQAQNYFFMNSGFMARQSWFQMCYESTSFALIFAFVFEMSFSVCLKICFSLGCIRTDIAFETFDIFMGKDMFFKKVILISCEGTMTTIQPMSECFMASEFQNMCGFESTFCAPKVNVKGRRIKGSLWCWLKWMIFSSLTSPLQL